MLLVEIGAPVGFLQGEIMGENAGQNGALGAGHAGRFLNDFAVVFWGVF